MQVTRLTPLKNNVKDSCSFTHNNKNYIMGTNLDGGGIVVFIEKEIPSDIPYELYDIGFKNWTWLWAPFYYKSGNTVYVFFNDIIKPSGNWTEACDNQRLSVVKYDIENKIWSHPSRVVIDDDSFGLIDGYVKEIDGLFYMLYTNTQTEIKREYWPIIPKCIQNKFKLYKTKKDTPWDIFYATSENLFGPYIGSKLLFKPENHIEEAPNWVGDDLIYWSENDSNIGSFIRRGNVIVEPDNSLSFIKDPSFKCEWKFAKTTTHPDMFKGKLRATIRDVNEEQLKFYIGEIT